MSWNVQVATWTANNRYPGIFRTVRARVAQRMGAGLGEGRLKILSFGCSDGSELSSLRAYFPDAQLYGCDVNPTALHAAAEAFVSDEAAIFESSPEAIRAHGPYDVIFAMSVLCRFPESMEPGRLDLRDIYPFGRFAEAVDVLAGSLRPGGMLVLYNTNYPFGALDVARAFRPVVSPLIGGNGFVDKFGADGGRMTWCEMRGRHFVHRPRAERPVAAVDYAHCVFERRGPDDGDDPIAVDAGTRCVADPGEAPDGYLFGPDLSQAVREGTIGLALAYWRGDAGATITRAWCRTTESGGVERGPAWSVAIDPAGAAPLTTDPALFKAEPAGAPKGLRFIADRLLARVSRA